MKKLLVPAGLIAFGFSLGALPNALLGGSVLASTMSALGVLLGIALVIALAFEKGSPPN